MQKNIWKLLLKEKFRNPNRYLAELYFNTYRFEEAAEMYENYADALTKKKQEATLYERE